MRTPQADVALTPEQEEAASRGWKALMPINGRPFLDYILSALADAGFDRVCIVMGPDHEQLRARYRDAPPERLTLSFQTQPQSLGTADALLQTESFAGGEEFLLVHADNYYLPRTLQITHRLKGPGLVGFRRDRLLKGGNITPERIANCALLEVDAEAYLTAIHEKPGGEVLQGLPDPVWLSMSCWRFGPGIFDACRQVALSERGEYEVPDAVTIAMRDFGERFRMLACEDTVLDLSSRRNVPEVEQLLSETAVIL